MNLRSTLIGIAASAFLLAVLGVARLFPTGAPTPDLLLREVETASFQPPPPPPLAQVPPPDAPPPPPALSDISQLADPTRVALPQALVPMDLRTPVEDFFTDTAPAPLPLTPEPAREAPAPRRTPPTPPSPTAAKTHYDASELDGTPRLLRHGSARFPSSLARKGVRRGTVTFEVEISSKGSVSIRRVLSTTHPELVPAARRVVAGARFTPPKHDGKVVTAIMRWPIVIQK